GASWDAFAQAADPPAASRDSALAQPVPDDALAASTAPAWVPSAPPSGGAAWETVLRFPGRILSLPFSAVGYIGRQSLGTVEDLHLVNRFMVPLAVFPQLGPMIAPPALGDRTGWGIAVGVAPPKLRGLSVRWDGTTRQYSRTHVAWAFEPVRVEYMYEWRPE